MKTGETVRDGRGRTFQVGQLLGRGLWGRTYGAREEGSGDRWVLKVPHGPEDLDGDDNLAETCRTVLLEQARLLEKGEVEGLQVYGGRFSLPDGTPVLVLPRAHATLEQRIAAGCSFEELVAISVGVVERLGRLADPVPFHGDLHPANVLLDERGQVTLADPVTPTLHRAMPELLRVVRPDAVYLAPEVRDATGSVPLGATADGYSVGMMLYRGILSAPTGGPERFPDLPRAGLDKARLVGLKDRVANRLKKEHSNPRFHTRLSDRTAALLNRAVSRETSPSPPYRFRRLGELGSRLSEILSLVHPSVTSVGRLIPEAAGPNGFTTEDEVGFSVAVGCTAGVESHEEIACGLAVFDVDRDERVREVQAAYTIDRHPSGRFRFKFRLADLGPGLFRIRVAFTIRESGDEPATIEGEVRVKPAPGYVPPPEQPQAAPLRMGAGPHVAGRERTDDASSITDPGRHTVSGLRTAPVGDPVARPTVAAPASTESTRSAPTPPSRPGFPPPVRPAAAPARARPAPLAPAAPAPGRTPPMSRGPVPQATGGRGPDAAVSGPVVAVSGPVVAAPVVAPAAPSSIGATALARAPEPVVAEPVRRPVADAWSPKPGRGSPSSAVAARPPVAPPPAAAPEPPKPAQPRRLDARRTTVSAARPRTPEPAPEPSFTGAGRWSQLPLPGDSAGPRSTSPGFTNPGVTSPGFTSPGVTSPGVRTSGGASPGVTNPASSWAAGLKNAARGASEAYAEREPGPVSDLARRASDIVRNDPVVLFIGVAAVAVAGLAVALLALS